MTDNKHQNDIDRLNSFLRGEISAVETYRQALEKVEDATAEVVLRNNLANHQGRVTSLAARILRLGGEPAESSGVWGAFAKAIEGGAKIFGESAAVAALEEVEDHGLHDYQNDLDRLSPEIRQMVATELLPEQQRTHDALSRLKKAMN
ncbi:MAG: demethoxyubiquinone hydroxylase family protein [Planctomycetota bacterium]